MNRRRRYRPEDALDAIAVTAFGAWVAMTVLSQHPYRMFDAVRLRSPFGVAIPDWRFFAPEPARHDHHLMVRILGSTGDVSPWRALYEFHERAWRQLLWFPAHRHEKALFDVCSEMQLRTLLTSEDITTSVPYALMRGFAERLLPSRFPEDPAPEGFQFLLLRAPGHDLTQNLEYQLISPFIPLTE